MAGKFVGALLVERGILTATQVDAVLERQRQTGQPFGQTAVAMFKVRMTDVWRALALQQKESLAHVDLDTLPPADQRALELVPARLAWAAKVLPLQFDGGALLCATTVRQLTDAMALLHESMDRPIHFVLADELQLKQHIMSCYPVGPVPV
jgi:hypothetical protein